MSELFKYDLDNIYLFSSGVLYRTYPRKGNNIFEQLKEICDDLIKNCYK